MHIRPYQEQAVAATWAWMMEHDGNPLVVMATGLGKSIVNAELCRQTLEFDPNTRIICVTHSTKLVEQNYQKFSDLCPNIHSGLYAAKLNKKQHNAQILFASIQSVYNKPEMIGRRSLMIIDECFSGDTLVKTTRGDVRIDLVRCGDHVYTASGIGIVEAVSCKPAKETYRLEFDDGTVTECTGNHPFFTGRGWKKANEMARGEVAFSIEAVRCLWQRFPSLDENIEGWEKSLLRGEILESPTNLLKILLEEIQESDALIRDKVKGLKRTKAHKTQTYQKRRERAITSLATDSIASCVGRWLGGRSRRSSRSWQSERIPYLLQNGLGEQGENDWDRTGRRESFHDIKQRERQEENRTSCFKRLVNISRIEREGFTPVFNLQVGGHPSFFANGALVHNCHTISRKSESMWGKFISGLRLYSPDMRIIGLSATPFRLDSGNLHEGDGAMFSGIAYEYGLLDGIKDGWLAPLVPKWTQTRMDVSGVHKRGGEFIESELQAAVDKDEVTVACVDEIIAYGLGKRKTWLVFCTGVQHCEHVAAEISSRGVTCAVVHGGMSNEEVEAVYRCLKNGTITAVCSVEMMTTGVDIPNIDLIAFMRPTASGPLVVQMGGRGTRLCSGKLNCLLLDFAKNIERHGPVDRIRGKPKSEGSGIPPMKACPECSTMVLISVMTCPDCGYHFPEPKKQEKLEAKPRNVAVTSDQHVVETQRVTHVQYVPWKGKGGKPDTLRVNYFDGVLRVASEWVCLMHPEGSYPLKKARAWLSKRCQFPNMIFFTSPDKAAEHLTKYGKIPTWIQTMEEGKFQKVVGYSALVSPEVPSPPRQESQLSADELGVLFE